MVITSNCGHVVLEGDEECDDGNQDPGDGCLAICAFKISSAVPECFTITLEPTPEST
jgi:cysteine-rich repeat protein